MFNGRVGGIYVLIITCFCFQANLLYADDSSERSKIRSIISDFIHSIDPDHDAKCSSCSCSETSIDHSCDHDQCSCKEVNCMDVVDEVFDEIYQDLKDYHGFYWFAHDHEQSSHNDHEHEHDHDHAHSHHHDHSHSHNHSDHHADHDHHHSFIMVVSNYVSETFHRIKEGLDVVGLNWKLQRYLDLNKDVSSQIKDHIANLVFIWPFSEVTEIVLAPVVGVVGSYLGLSNSLLIPLVSVSSLTALPGICPLCMGLFLIYPLTPVHKSISFLRKSLVSILSYKIPYMDSISLFKRQDRISYLVDGSSRTFKLKGLRVKKDQHQNRVEILDSTDKVLISLNYFIDQSDQHLSSIFVDSSLLTSLQDTQESFRIFSELGWSVSYFLKKLSVLTKGANSVLSSEDDIRNLESNFYVKKVEIKENGVYIEFVGSSMGLSTRINCMNFFSFSKD